MPQVQTTLAELIRTKTGVEPQENDSLDSLKIDSLAMAELTVEIEKACDVRVGEDVIEVTTFRELCDYIEKRLASPQET